MRSLYRLNHPLCHSRTEHAHVTKARGLISSPPTFIDDHGVPRGPSFYSFHTRNLLFASFKYTDHIRMIHKIIEIDCSVTLPRDLDNAPVGFVTQNLIAFCIEL